MKFLTGILLTSMMMPAMAGVIRHDVDDSNYRALGNLPEFSAVGAVIGSTATSGYGCSGTAINANWILTAAHCVDEATGIDFYAKNSAGHYQQYAASNWFAFSGWDNSNLVGGADLGLIYTPQAIDTHPASIYRGSNELFSTSVSVGFGTFGDGLIGNIFDYGTKRGGMNVIDVLWSDGGNGEQMLWSDFDHPTDPSFNFFDFPEFTEDDLAISLEYAIAPGDSGGGLFIWEDDQFYLAGVHSIGADINGDGLVDYGDIYASTRVSSLAGWIDHTIATAAVPEPGAGALLLAGLFGMFSFRRKRAEAV